MIVNEQLCHFYNENYCVHTDRRCEAVCKWAVKKHDNVTFGEAFAVYWSRRDRYRERMLKWLALAISIAALAISLVSLSSSSSASRLPTSDEIMQEEPVAGETP